MRNVVAALLLALIVLPLAMAFPSQAAKCCCHAKSCPMMARCAQRSCGIAPMIASRAPIPIGMVATSLRQFDRFAHTPGIDTREERTLSRGNPPELRPPRA